MVLDAGLPNGMMMSSIMRIYPLRACYIRGPCLLCIKLLVNVIAINPRHSTRYVRRREVAVRGDGWRGVLGCFRVNIDEIRSSISSRLLNTSFRIYNLSLNLNLNLNCRPSPHHTSKTNATKRTRRHTARIEQSRPQVWQADPVITHEACSLVELVSYLPPETDLPSFL